MKKLLLLLLLTCGIASAQNEVNVQELDNNTFHVYSVDLPTDFMYLHGRTATGSVTTFSFNGNIFTYSTNYNMSPEFSTQINQIHTDASVNYGYVINEERRMLNDIIPSPFDPFSEFRDLTGWSITTTALGPIPDSSSNTVLQYDDIYTSYLIIGGGYYQPFPVVAPETHIQVQQRIITWWNDPANHPNG